MTDDLRTAGSAFIDAIVEAWDDEKGGEPCDVGTRTASTSPDAATRTVRTAAPSEAATAATAAPDAPPDAPAGPKRTLYLLPRVEGSSLLRVAERDGTIVKESYSGTELVRWTKANGIKVEKMPT